MKPLLTLLAILANLLLLHAAKSMEAPMSPAQDARAKQMQDAIDEAAKLPAKWHCVPISERVCVSPELAKRLRK